MLKSIISNPMLRKRVLKFLKIGKNILGFLILLYIGFFIYDNVNSIDFTFSLLASIAVLGILISSTLIRSVRFFILSNEIVPNTVDLRTSLDLTFSSYFLNGILPGRLGEIVKFIGMKASKAQVLKIILFDKLTEFATIIWNFLFLLIYFEVIEFNFIIYLVISFIGVIGISIILTRTREIQIRYLGTKISFVRLIIYSVLIFVTQFLDAFALKMVFSFFSLEIEYLPVLLALLAGQIMFAIPIAPGALGQYEYSIAYFIDVLGGDLTEGIYAASVFRVFSLISFGVLGLYPSAKYYFAPGFNQTDSLTMDNTQKND